MPAGCHFTVDPNDACCQKLTCDPAAVKCVDTVDCKAYGSFVCRGYKDWAESHCPKYCAFCGGGMSKVNNKFYTNKLFILKLHTL